MEFIKRELSNPCGSLLWENYLENFLEVYFSEFLRLVLHESITESEVLEPTLRPSLSYLKEKKLRPDFHTLPTLHCYFDDFNSFFNSRYDFAVEFNPKLRNSLWWTLFNSKKSPLQALCCNSCDGFGDVYLGFNAVKGGNKKINYSLNDVHDLSHKLRNYCLEKYGDFILSNL